MSGTPNKTLKSSQYLSKTPTRAAPYRLHATEGIQYRGTPEGKSSLACGLRARTLTVLAPVAKHTVQTAEGIKIPENTIFNKKSHENTINF